MSLAMTETLDEASTKQKNVMAEKPDAIKKILIEIVSAWDLFTFDNGGPFNPYCECLGSSRVIHKTKSAKKTWHPIWTIRTCSLFLLDIHAMEKEIANGLKFEVKYKGVLHNHSFGYANVPYATLISGEGERIEYQLQKDNGPDRSYGTLALRYREATKEDEDFMRDLASTSNLVAESGPRYPVHPKPKKNRKPYSSEPLFLVKPFPDPENVESTTWMTKAQINDACMETSHNWIKAGKGRVGRIFLEIIKCDNLPNLDKVKTVFNSKDVTDPFAKIIVEDTCVSTDIIYDTLSPRWMPWSRRAFVLPIVHPRSPVIIGLFHVGALQNDNIGRIIMDIGRLRNDVDYILTFDLHNDPVKRKKKAAGTITVRVRLKWKNQRYLLKAFLSTPPRHLVNVASDKEFKNIRYMCKGETNEEKSSMLTVKYLLSEVLSYGEVFFYFIDAFIQILLWRGQTTLILNGQKVSVWVPIHSMAFFFGGITLAEDFSLLPTFIFSSLTWMMLTLMVNTKNHPNPWSRCMTFTGVLRNFIFRDTAKKHFQIDPMQGHEECKEYELLCKLKSERLSSYFWAFIESGLKYKRKYMASSADSIAIETEDTSFALLGENLYYLHLPLYYMCIMLRSTSSLLAWKLWSNAFVVTAVLLTCSIISFFLPWQIIGRWSARLFFWSFGPWMKILDLYVVQDYYKTDAQLMKTKEYYKPNFDSFFETEKMRFFNKRAKIATEDAFKLKDMRIYRFGKYSEEVPDTSLTRYPDAPRPESFAVSSAQGSNELLCDNIVVDIPGQKLGGNMILRPL